MNTLIHHPELKPIAPSPGGSPQSETPFATSTNRHSVQPFIWVVLIAGLLFLLFRPTAVSADQQPPGCNGSGLGILLFTDAPHAHIGNTLNYSVTVFNGLCAGPVVCDATAIRALVVTPDGVSHPLALVRTNLANGELDFYPNVVSYVVRAQDVRPDATVRAVASDTGVIHQNNINSQGGGNEGVNTEVSQPGIRLAMQCVGRVGENGALMFTGMITNSGNVALTNVVVVSDRPAANTTVFTVSTLAAGAAASFTGTYLAPTNDCSVTTTFSGTARDIDSLTTVTNTGLTTCSVTTTPGITITETCPPGPVSAGASVAFGGWVSNTGNVALANVSVFSGQPGNAVVLGPITLAPGDSAPFAGNYIATGGLNPTAEATVVTNGSRVITTNIASVITTNTTTIVTTNPPGPVTFGTINSVSQTAVDRFLVGSNFNGLTYAPEDHGYAATQFYSVRRGDSGTSIFDTITASTAATADRFDASNRTFDALTYAADNLSYGPLLFYYLSHDNTGVSTFGSITPGGVVGVTTDHFVVGSSFDALTYAATDVGYGANLFYYVRHDATGLSTFGTIDPHAPGTITDRFTVGTNVDALVFTDLIAPGYGANNFYYLRHDANQVSTFGTILVTGLTNATVTDRFTVGINAAELTFTATDVGSFGPNLFYFLRGSGLSLATNITTTFDTNTVTTFATNTLITYTTNSAATFTPTNTVTAIGRDICQSRTVVAAVNCLGPVAVTSDITGQDVKRPTIGVTVPATNARYTNNVGPMTGAVLTMAGIAKDDFAVREVRYSINGSPFQPATMTDQATMVNWTGLATLAAGVNTVTIKSIDCFNQESLPLTRTFFYVVQSSFTLATNGLGTIMSAASSLGTPTNGAILEVGRTYQLLATPGPNTVFSNWTGVASNSALLRFVMQPDLALTGNFIPNPFISVAGVYNGLFYETNVVAHHSSGFLTMSVATNFSFSGKLSFDGDTLATSGKFNLDGTLITTLSRAPLGKSDVTLRLFLDFSHGNDQITGSVSNVSWLANLAADRATFNAFNNPATNFSGLDTMLIPGFTNAADGPMGYGNGAITVLTNGQIKMTGTLADGAKIVSAVPISKSGQWPLYAMLYRQTESQTNLITHAIKAGAATYKGSVLGWVTFTNAAPAGVVSVIKTALSPTNIFYPDGFTNRVELLGSAFTIPAAGTRVLDFTNATNNARVILGDGNLSAPLNYTLTITTNNVVTKTGGSNPNKFTWLFSPKTGLITGTFVHVDNTTKVTSFFGAVLQNRTNAGGAFLGTNQGGSVLLQGN